MASTISTGTTSNTATGATGTISFDGLATGINSSSIIDQLMAVEGRQKTLKEAEQVRLQNQATAWQGINTNLLDLREKAKALWSNSAWSTATGTSSDATVLTATTTTAAIPGTYTFKVTQLAQNQQLASTGYSSAYASVGAGTLTVGLGANTTALTIGGSNNTLAGVAKAINDADVGITASVINDGTEGTGYKLLLSSNSTGADNTITAAGTDGLTMTFPTELQAAQDAKLVYGSGAGAMTITSASNNVTEVVPGVTLNLLSQEKPTTAVTLTVARSTTNVETAIQSFVDSYNTAMTTIGSQFLFDSKTNTGGILMGDQTLVSIQNRIQGFLVSPVATNGTYKSLQALGLKLQDDGSLQFDKTVFSSAVTTDYASVAAMFQTTGRSDAAKLSFIYAGKDAVEPSSSTGYAVAITQAATQTSRTAASGVGSLTLTGANNQLTLSVNGGSAFTVALDYASTYGSYADLASALQTKINAASTDAPVTVSADGSKLTITSQRYGSASGVTIWGGSGQENLGFTSSVLSQGVDVAGTINGEEATGSGKSLVGKSGNAKTAGVQLEVDFTPADVLAGTAAATLFFSKGVAARFNEYLQDLTDPITGSIETSQEGIQRSIDDLTAQMDEMQTRLDAKRARLTLMFQKMESAVSAFNSQGSYLTQALAGITANNNA